MLHKRLIAGSMMAAAAGGVLFADAYLAPYYPVLLGLIFLLSLLSVREYVSLVRDDERPNHAMLLLGVFALNFCNFLQAAFAPPEYGPRNWDPLFLTFLASAVTAFLWEMAWFRVPGRHVARTAYNALGLVYLGVLPAFFLKIRWLTSEHSGWMLALAIFVPKCGDIAAYFSGRFLGRIKFSPWLSPKKTWEGFAGGLLGSVFVAVAIHAVFSIFKHGYIEAVGFGLIIGVVAVLGDLAESLIKRDGQMKDASRSIPGFGGVLDVVDSILFAGPAAYLWFAYFEG